MPRYGAKTYGRSAQRDTQASKAFDNMVFDNNGSESKPSASKAAGTVMKWGKTQFTSTRGGSYTPTDPDPKKRKVTCTMPAAAATEPIEIYDDPFSFDSDEDGPGSPVRNQRRPAVLQSNIRPKTNALKSLQTNTRVIEIRTDADDDVGFRKTGLHSYTRTITPSTKSRFTSITSSGNSKKQTYMDRFTNRTLTVSKGAQAKSSNANNVVRPRKFFTSSQSSADHTYSQSSAGDSEKLDGYESDGSEGNYNSDMDSGDPEIIFNSPKKREEEIQRRIALGLSKDSTDEEIEISDECDSPITVSSTGSNDQVDHQEKQRPATYSRFGSIKTYSKSLVSCDNGGASKVSANLCNPKLLLKKKFSLVDSESDKKKRSKDPIVRKLLTSPKKVSVLNNSCV